MERNLLFVCSDMVIDSFTLEEALKSQTKFSLPVNFEDLFDLSKQLNRILNDQNIPEQLQNFINIWDIAEKRLILRIFGNCYHHYPGSN